MVEMGELRPISDIGGRNVIRFDGSPASMGKLVERLKSAGCAVDDRGGDWRDPRRFARLDAYDRRPGERHQYSTPKSGIYRFVSHLAKGRENAGHSREDWPMRPLARFAVAALALAAVMVPSPALAADPVLQSHPLPGVPGGGRSARPGGAGAEPGLDRRLPGAQGRLSGQPRRPPLERAAVGRVHDSELLQPGRALQRERHRLGRGVDRRDAQRVGLHRAAGRRRVRRGRGPAGAGLGRARGDVVRCLAAGNRTPSTSTIWRREGAAWAPHPMPMRKVLAVKGNWAVGNAPNEDDFTPGVARFTGTTWENVPTRRRTARGRRWRTCCRGPPMTSGSSGPTTRAASPGPPNLC